MTQHRLSLLLRQLVDHVDAPCGQQAVRTRGPTILVMPFAAATPEDVADADSITCDIIFGIAKLRSISIIARGTAFSLRSQTPAAAAALVIAQYVASGHLRRDGKRYLVSVELTDPKSGRIFWADEFSCNAVDSFSAPPLLAARIVAGLDAEIHVIERNRTLLTPPASLDAWRRTISGSPTCTALRAPTIVRRNSSSPERSRSTQPSREAMPGYRSPIFKTDSCSKRASVNARSL